MPLVSVEVLLGAVAFEGDPLCLLIADFVEVAYSPVFVQES